MVSPPVSEQEIQILICSANLGNAPPDAASVAEWIPRNGIMTIGTTQQRFPVVMDPRRAVNPPDGSASVPRSPGALKRVSTGVIAPPPREGERKLGVARTRSSEGLVGTSLSFDEFISTGSTSSGSFSFSDESLPTKFDIVVIGLQEATFDRDKEDKNDDADINSVDDAYLSAEEDLELVANESGSFDVYGSSKDSDNEGDSDGGSPIQSTKKKSVSGKIICAGLKMGKVGLKVGKAGYKVSKKMTKATYKTAKTVNTLASFRDHTDRPFPSSLPQGNESGLPGWSSTDVLHYRFEEQLPTYERAVSCQLGQMRLIIYYNASNIDVDVNSVKYKPTGLGGLANKGGIVAEVTVNELTRLSFLTAHLEAHEGDEKYQTRCTSFMDILSNTKSRTTPVKLDVSLASHFTFCMGDLNFRTRVPGVEPGSERHVKICHNITKAKDWVLLNRYDELASAVRNKDCLAGFRTPYCNFDPTFKVARQLGYEYNPKRSPSFTDRILFKTGDQLEAGIKPVLYEPIERFTTSDHKPIRGAFSIRLNDRLQWKPSASILNRSRETTTVNGGDQLQSGKRETMHVLVSSMSIGIDPTNYDKLRKMEKAPLPDSYLSFAVTPSEAIQVDVSKKSLWQKLDLDSTTLGMPDAKKMKSVSSCKLTPKGFPRTSTAKDTMKPHWKGDYLHFSIRTHVFTGDPVDLSGSLLHAILHDKREDKAIGACSINLAQLIRKTKDPSSFGARRRDPGGPTSPGSLSGPTSPPNSLKDKTVIARGRDGVRGFTPPMSPANSQAEMRYIPPSSKVRTSPSSKVRTSPSAGSTPQSPMTSSSDPRFTPVNNNVGGRRAAVGPSLTMPTRSTADPLSMPIRSRSVGRQTLPSPGRGVAPPSPGRFMGEGRFTPTPMRSESGGGLRVMRAVPSSSKSGDLRPVQMGGRGQHPPSSPRIVTEDPRTIDGVAGGHGRGPSRRTARSPVAARLRGSLKHVALGASKSMQEVLAAEDDAVGSDAIFNRLRDLKVVALQLDEALFEGGLEIARLKCNLDVWWVQDQE